MNLTPVQNKFVLHWGEMGTRWGINRTVAQVHALLFISPEPLNAEEIAETLSVARSNVSTSLRELQGWGIVRVSHKLGDRRDYFEALKDVWELYRIVLDERKRREVDPTIEMLRQCVAEAGGDKRDGGYTRERLTELLKFLETMGACYEQARKLPKGALAALAKAGAGWSGLLGLGKKKPAG